MAFTNADLLALKDELTNDPNSLGLVAPPAIDDIGNAEKLNEVLDTQQIDRQAIPISEVVTAIDADEFLALAEGQQRYIQMITASGTVNPESGSEVREALLQFFSAQSETRTSLTALLTEPANRIEQMFRQGLLSQGGSVTTSDVANARNATP